MDPAAEAARKEAEEAAKVLEQKKQAQDKFKKDIVGVKQAIDRVSREETDVVLAQNKLKSRGWGKDAIDFLEANWKTEKTLQTNLLAGWAAGKLKLEASSALEDNDVTAEMFKSEAVRLNGLAAGMEASCMKFKKDVLGDFLKMKYRSTECQNAKYQNSRTRKISNARVSTSKKYTQKKYCQRDPH